MNLAELNTETKLCGVIGYPLGHSLSPIMHKSAFNKLGLDYDYLIFEVHEQEFSSAFEDLKSKGFRGLNVTMPYKLEIMEYLDNIEASTRDIGAVNTIVNDDGVLTGYNTDGFGALEALRSNGVDFKNLKGKILIMGAGGAARAIAITLTKLGAEIIIANRTFQSGETLVNTLKNIGTSEAIKIAEISENIDEVELVINCTSVGMHGGPEGSLLPEELIRNDMIVFDIVYSPKNTPLLTVAEKCGAKVIYGYEMLVHQGARAFELWTGETAPLEVMRQAVLGELG